MITEDDVKSILKNCYDPEIPINIVDLGLVYGIKIDDENKKIKVTMTLTSPGCPMYVQISEDVKRKVEEGTGYEANVEMVWEPRWTQDKMSEDAKAMIGI
ncbi:MAG: metal-sulfur cluster assembly factor [Candidatus Aenigmarchaeota archaeon]|nr:metal-sulfur cluster assembly factor [Candidatus Aenigmarchaeota archaeon]